MEDPLGVVKTFASIQVSADSRWCRKVRKKRHEGVFVVYKGGKLVLQEEHSGMDG